MDIRDVIVAVLLAGGIGVELLSCVGMFVMQDVFDRLHYLGPACTLGPFLVAASILVEENFSLPANKALLVMVIIVATTPALTHATARAARVRMFGHWRAAPAEIADA